MQKMQRSVSFCPLLTPCVKIVQPCFHCLLSPEQKASPRARKKARQDKVANSTLVLYNLSKSLLNLHAELLTLPGASVQDNTLLPKQV